jgi:hypothetical protein
MALTVEAFLPWVLMLIGGILIAAQWGIGYVGTQAAVAFICTLVQGPGPPASILPGIERLAGITGGLLILLAVTVLTALGVRPQAVLRGSGLSPDQ